MWAVLESLGKDSPGELCGEVNVRVSPGKDKNILRLRAERNREKSILGLELGSGGFLKGW